MNRSLPARIFERLGLEVFRRETMPRSIRLDVDLARILGPSRAAFDFIDVGANIGQTARYLRAYFPNARIFCIEPIENVFTDLQNHTHGLKGVECRRIAVTSTACDSLWMEAAENTLVSRVVTATATHRTDFGESGLVKVPATTLDAFFESEGLRHVDFLKIDAEGHDLQVLQGAASTLGEQRISAVLCEVSLNPNGVHTDYESVAGFLRGFGMTCFGFYGFSDWRAVRARGFGYCNALFVLPERM